MTEQLFDSFEDLSKFEDTRPSWVKELHGTLSDRDIARLILTGEIKITPMPNLEEDLDSCKLDFRLGDKFTRIDYSKLREVIDAKKEIPEEALIREFVSPESPITIPPNELIIAATKESFKLPNYIMARLEGKSGVARLGLLVEAAPVFDAGWSGNGAMEIVNPGRVPITIYEGQKICAMNFHLLSTPAIKSRNKEFGKIRNQTGPDISKINQEFVQARIYNI